MVVPGGKETLQQWGAAVLISFVFLAFSTPDFAIGQTGPQHPAASAASKQGVEASNGVTPMKSTTALATTLLKYFILNIS